MTVIDYIKLYLKNSISFFPLFPSTKVPVVKHTPYYERLPTKEEIRQWLQTYLNPEFWRQVWEGKIEPKLREKWIQALKKEFEKIGRDINEYKYEGEVNLAVAGGYNNLVLIDIEDATKFAHEHQILKLFKAYGFVVVKTGKPHGYHLYCISDWNKNVKGKNGEIRVYHQYVAAPPSRHPNGQYYKFLTELKLQKVSKDVIENVVLDWIEAKISKDTEEPKIDAEKIKEKIKELEDTEAKEKVAGAKIIWDEIKNAAKQLPVIHGKRSDWTFALTLTAKALFDNPKYVFKELLEIPIIYSKCTRDDKWGLEKAYEWWYKYEWEDVEKCSIFSIKTVIKWAEKVTGLKLNLDIEELIDNFLRKTKEKGYGHSLKEHEIVLEIAYILDNKCLTKIETKNGTKIDVASDWMHILAEEINNMFFFVALQETDELLIYKDGVYKECEAWLKRILQLAWNVSKFRQFKPLTNQRVNEVIGMIKRMNYKPLEEFYKYNRKYINVKNGLINMETWKLEPHRPEILFLTQLNAEYKEDVVAKEWDDFLRQVTDEAYIPVLQEFCGYCLLPDCRFEKALAIVGPGGSGKSTFLEVIRSVLGFENTTSFSIQQLENERFSRAELIGKLANIYNDLPYDQIEKSDVFKQLVSGDPIQVEKKFRQPFLARLHVKLIFSANQLPQTKDTSSAFFRRWIIVPFPNTIQNPDPSLKLRLSRDERVKSYVLKWMIEGLKRLLKNNKFSYPYTWEEIAEFYTQASDSVKAFISDHIVEYPGGRIKKSELYQLYVNYCKENGYPPVSNVEFAKRLRMYIPKIEEKKVMGTRYWVGITYVESKEKEPEDYSFDLSDYL